MIKSRYSLGKLENSTKNYTLIKLGLCKHLPDKFSTLNNELATRMACKLIVDEKEIFKADRYVVIGIGESALLGYLIADKLTGILRNVEFISTVRSVGRKENAIGIHEEYGIEQYILLDKILGYSGKTRYIIVKDEFNSSNEVHELIRDLESVSNKDDITGYNVVSILKSLDLTVDESEIYKRKIRFSSLDVLNKNVCEVFDTKINNISGDSDYTIDDKTFLDNCELDIIEMNKLDPMVFMSCFKNDTASLDIIDILAKELESGKYKKLVLVGTEQFNVIHGEIAKYFENSTEIDVRLHFTTREKILPMVNTSNEYLISNRVDFKSAYGDYTTYLYNTNEYRDKEYLVAVITDNSEYISQLIQHFEEADTGKIMLFTFNK